MHSSDGKKKLDKGIKAVPFSQILYLLLGFILRLPRKATALFVVLFIIAGLLTGEYMSGFGWAFLCLIFMGLMMRIAGVVETRSFSKLRSLKWWKGKDLDA